MKRHWRGLLTVVLIMLVVGNSAVTLILYLIGQPNLTAWTGHVPQSTPSAVNDLILGAIDVCLVVLIFQRHG